MLKKLVLFGLAVLVGGVFVSCAKKQVVKPEVVEEFKAEAEEPGIRGKEFQKIDELSVINFDYDKSSLASDARAVLRKNAGFLKENTDIEVLVEGHCDERGSMEYNIALGQRRATAVRKYYIQMGVSADKISTISYGEERPVDSAGNESAWSKNRRAETLVRAGQ